MSLITPPQSSYNSVFCLTALQTFWVSLWSPGICFAQANPVYVE